MVKPRLVLPVLAAAAALTLLAGCGGSDGSSSTDPASVAPPDTQVFVEAKIQPTGKLKANLEGIANRVAGVDDLGATIVSYLEALALNSDEPLDFEKEIQPWLGESAGVFLTGYNGDDFEPGGFVVEVTDTGDAQEFVDKQVESENEKVTDESYEGVDYKLGSADEDGVGIVGNFLVFGDSKAAFEAAVDASKGESLAEVDNYSSITPSSPEGSLADVYVDIGSLIETAGSEVDPSAKKLFEATGVDVEDASALLSLVPGSDNVEIDVAGKLGAPDSVPTEDAAALLGSMPANAVAAIGVGELGKNVGEAIDTIDEQGIPGEIPPNQLKDTMKKAGIDLGKITANLGDAAVFVQGGTRATLAGALVIEAKDATEARNTVSNVGTLLRANGTPGVTAVSGKASGFSVRSADLGAKPLVVAAEGERIAIGYGLPATLAGLESESAPTLAKTKAYNEALDSLGGTPITGFAAGAPALRLAEGLLTEAGEREELEELTPYLSKVPFLAIGSETKGDVVQAKLIVGVTD